MRPSLYDRLIPALAVVGALAFLAAGVLILVDVTLRASGLFPLRAASALSEYALLVGTMAGAPWLVRKKGHIAVTSLVDALPPAVARGVGVVAAGIAVAVLGLLAWRAALIGWQKALSGAMDLRSIAVPEWVGYAILSIGFLLMATEFARLIIRGDTAPGGGGGL